MFRGALTEISNVDVIGMVGLLFALMIFIVAVIWALRLSKQDIDRFSRLPLLEDESDRPDYRSKS